MLEDKIKELIKLVEQLEKLMIRIISLVGWVLIPLAACCKPRYFGVFSFLSAHLSAHVAIYEHLGMYQCSGSLRR